MVMSSISFWRKSGCSARNAIIDRVKAWKSVSIFDQSIQLISLSCA